MSISLLGFVLGYLGSLVAALLVDGAFAVYLYELMYFLNPPSRWWAQPLPDLRFTFIVAIVVMGAYLMRMSKYAGNRFFEAPQMKELMSNLVFRH